MPGPVNKRRERLYDRIHRGFVWGCVGLTAYGLYLAGLRAHRYFTVIKPLQEERQRQKELELLAEGQASNAPLIPNPPDSKEELKY